MSKTIIAPAAKAAATAVACLLAAGVSAHARSVGPLTYLVSHGGPILASGAPLNPGVIVGFNPQPDPPGVPPTALDLQNPSVPELNNTADGGTFDFVFALQGLGDAVIPLPAAPNADGVTGFRQEIDGHLVDVNIIFGGGPVIPGSWVIFNPQPDPPGDVLSADIGFAADPSASFDVTVDGNLLSFSAVPEPASWALMTIGFGLTGATLRRRARPAALIQGQIP